MEAIDTADAPGVVTFQDDLGVALGEKTIAQGAQFGAQLLVVVDAAVEHDAQTECIVHHRLLGMFGEVDDLEAAVRGRQMVHLMDAAGVRSTRDQNAVYSLQGFDWWLGSIEADFPADSTHLELPKSAEWNAWRPRVVNSLPNLASDFSKASDTCRFLLTVT